MTIAEELKFVKWGLRESRAFMLWCVAKKCSVKTTVDEYDVVQVWHFKFIDGSEYIMRIYIYG